MTQTQKYHRTRTSLSGELIDTETGDIDQVDPSIVDLLNWDNISDVSLRYPDLGEVVTYRKATA